MFAGLAIGPIFLRDVVAQLLELLDRALGTAFERHERDDRLSGRRVGPRRDRGLGHLRVVDERALDLDRRDPVARDVHHVVDAPEEPEVAVLVDPCAVAREVDVAVPRPVGLDVAVVIACRCRAASPATAGGARGSRRRPGRPRGPARRRPRRRRPGTAASPSRASCVVTPGSGVIMIIPVSVCHHVSTIGHRPPPMCSWYQIHASGLIGSPTEPSRRSDERSCFCGVLRPPLHVRPDRGRRGVEDRHAVTLDDRPPAVLVGEVGRALVEDAGRPVAERPVDDVAVARDPADVGRAPVDVCSGLRSKT